MGMFKEKMSKKKRFNTKRFSLRSEEFLFFTHLLYTRQNEQEIFRFFLPVPQVEVV